MWVAQPLQGFYKLFYPIIWLLNHAAFWLLRRCGIQPASEAELIHSEEEIRLILGRSRRYAKGSRLGQEIALNAFTLRHRRVWEVMRPRPEIISLNTEDTIKECVALAREARYSRYPLCEGGHLDKTLGVVHSKDLVGLQNEASRGLELAAVAHKIIFVPKRARLETLLGLFLQCNLHLALVVNEFGSTVGLVTLEDVLEELVGPIEDEFHHEEAHLRRTGEKAWELTGSLRLRKLAELIGRPLEESADASSVSGLMIQRLGRLPRSGDVLALDAWELCVEEITGRGIARIELTRRTENDETAFTENAPLSGLADSYRRELQRAGRRRSPMEHVA